MMSCECHDIQHVGCLNKMCKMWSNLCHDNIWSQGEMHLHPLGFNATHSAFGAQ